MTWSTYFMPPTPPPKKIVAGPKNDQKGSSLSMFQSCAVRKPLEMRFL